MNAQRPPDERLSRLRRLTIADAALAGAGGTAAIVVSLTVARESALFGLGVFVLLCATAIASTLKPLGRGDTDGAARRFAVANWVVAVGAAVVGTFAWPLLMQAALLPAAVAASFVSEAQLRRYVGVSLVASVVVACLGLLQDITGLSDRLPSSVRTTMLLAVGPLMASLVVLVALQHHVYLQRAISDEQEARESLAAHVAELRRSRLRVVAATDRERQRIERDLHDGAQSRLVAVNLGLARLKSALDQPSDDAASILHAVSNEVHLARTELRDLAHGVYPTVLTQHGVAAAIAAAADRSAIPVRLDLADIGRHHDDVEAAIYFCTLEATQNASKHSRAAAVTVVLGRDDDHIYFEVSDDGVGFDPKNNIGHGLANMTDRLGAIGGELAVTSVRASGTTVTGRVPVTIRSGRESAFAPSRLMGQ